MKVHLNPEFLWWAVGGYGRLASGYFYRGKYEARWPKGALIREYSNWWAIDENITPTDREIDMTS
jgi:hypothetical protein